MSFSDCIGFAGVTILLIAFFLNLINKLSKDNLGYIILNLTGAAMACIASVLINYLPFIILEACWTAVSAWGLIIYFRK